jgi:hypothetical protein
MTCELPHARVRGAQLLQKSEDEDHEQRQNEVFWKIDVGATDKAVDGAPLDRGARPSRRALVHPAARLPACSQCKPGSGCAACHSSALMCLPGC